MLFIKKQRNREMPCIMRFDLLTKVYSKKKGEREGEGEEKVNHIRIKAV
jgi:hypothetical protein